MLPTGWIAGLTDEKTVAQLATVRYKVDERGLVRIESKEKMREDRQLPSPDHAEGLMLAFAPIEYAALAAA